MSSDLSLKISQAQKNLKASFGLWKEGIQEGTDVYRYLDEESLSDVYKEDASLKEVAAQFAAMSKSIRNMRATYLPIDFFSRQFGPNESIVDIQNQNNVKEPYENTFMRMLGMPSVAKEGSYTSDSNSIIIDDDSELYTLDPETGELVLTPFRDIRFGLLNERRARVGERKIAIDNSVFAISTDIGERLTKNLADIIPISNLDRSEKAYLFGFEYNEDLDQVYIVVRKEGLPQDIIYEPIEGDEDNVIIDITSDIDSILKIERAANGKDYINPSKYADPGSATISTIPESRVASLPIATQSQEVVTANIQNLSSDIYKFSYLLIPPIQDAEISKFINEPDKIVAPPFSGDTIKKINQKKPRPTLLESIIRIRLDKISGSTSFVSQQEDSEIIPLNDIDGEEPAADDFGVLESLFILRLRTAIRGLARKTVGDIDSFIHETEVTQRKIAEETLDQEDVGSITPVGAAASLEATDASSGKNPEVPLEPGSENNTPVTQGDDPINDVDYQNLLSQRLIEESILSLLGNNSEVLDLQFQTQRSSSIYDSHMMSGLIDIVNVPRRRIDEEISEIVKVRTDRANAHLERFADRIKATLGLDMGIGTLDLSVFSLALFTLNESSLLGLLTPKQIDNMKNGDFKSLFEAESEIIPDDPVTSINNLTELLKQGYDLFKSDLSDSAEFIPEEEVQ